MLDIKPQVILVSQIFFFVSYSTFTKAQANISSEIVYKKISIDSTISISIPDYLIQVSAPDDETSTFENIFNDTHFKIEKLKRGNESLERFFRRTAKNLESQNYRVLSSTKIEHLDLTEIRIVVGKKNESEAYINRISILEVNATFIIISFWTKEANNEYLKHFESAQNTIATQ